MLVISNASQVLVRVLILSGEGRGSSVAVTES